MKVCCILLVGFCLFSAPAFDMTVYCTNCSNQMTQALERVTNVSQLNKLIDQYAEAAQQTQQQIRMVQQNIEQYQNMLQNTAQLPAHLVNQLNGSLLRLASLTRELKTQRGDVVGLGQVFMNLFPDQSEFADLAGTGPQGVNAANARYREKWDSWSESVDQASQATFQLSGKQLEDLQGNASDMQAYLDQLLATPDGQMRAIQAGNQLASIQIQEARQLRELMATTAQSSLAAQMKAEKEGQMEQELWRDMTKTDKLGGLTSKPDPF